MQRWEVVSDLLQNRRHETGAEIGVKEGRTSGYLLNHLPDLRTLYCVDPWRYYPEYESDRNPKAKSSPYGEWPSQAALDQAYNRFCRRIEAFADHVVVLRMMSREAAPEVPDDSLDFVFIDANHAYEFVREDILLWTPKVKPGGIVIGHDYNRWPHIWGVARAVDEAFGDRVHKAPNWCWWVERI